MHDPPKPKLRRRRLGEELTAQLCQHIIDEGLKPGDALLTEQQMAKRFGVSHSVVREATKTLDFLGIIAAAPCAAWFWTSSISAASANTSASISP